MKNIHSDDMLVIILFAFIALLIIGVAIIMITASSGGLLA